MSFYSFYAIINYKIQSQEIVNLSLRQFISVGSWSQLSSAQARILEDLLQTSEIFIKIKPIQDKRPVQFFYQKQSPEKILTSMVKSWLELETMHQEKRIMYCFDGKADVHSSLTV